MKNKLDKKDVLWIFAFKDNRTKEHYERYYGKYEGQPTNNTLYEIFSQVIDKIDDWKQVMNLLRSDRVMHRMFNKMKIQKELKQDVTYKEIEPTFEEWMVYGFIDWACHVTRDMLNEWCGGKHWEKWVDDERASYKDSEEEK
jgi:hypothetical protein